MFDQLSEKLSQSIRKIKGQATLNEKNIEEGLKEIRMALLSADVNFKVVKEFVNAVKEKALGADVTVGVNPGQQLVKIVHEELTHILGGEHTDLNFNRQPPAPVVLVGLHGVGKTTMAAKLALYMRKRLKKNPYLVPADIYRPAAKKQLQVFQNLLKLQKFRFPNSSSILSVSCSNFSKNKMIKRGCESEEKNPKLINHLQI